MKGTSFQNLQASRTLPRSLLPLPPPSPVPSGQAMVISPPNGNFHRMPSVYPNFMAQQEMYNLNPGLFQMHGFSAQHSTSFQQHQQPMQRRNRRQVNSPYPPMVETFRLQSHISPVQIETERRMSNLQDVSVKGQNRGEVFLMRAGYYFSS